MKDCKTVRDELVAFLDGESSSPAADLIRRHLGSCPDCQKEAELLAEVGESVSALPLLEPRGDHLDRLQTKLYRHQRLIWLRRAAVLVPLAAALLFALLLPYRETSDTMPPEATEIVRNLELLSNLECLENLPVLEVLEELEVLALLSEGEESGES